ncbi:MAG: hypothetical protein H0V88_01710 [Pyrinomonadaceae bacterium]|nr:hypothetical protein [Pyrinomonadaceae bacterium]
MTKEGQSKAGIPQKRRGQQMGDAANPDQNREEMNDTPSLRGRRADESEHFADESTQQTGSDAVTPRSNTPSVPAAMPAGEPLGESGGERAFKAKQVKNKRTN